MEKENPNKIWDCAVLGIDTKIIAGIKGGYRRPHRAFIEPVLSYLSFGAYLFFSKFLLN
jgi:hypothetical protein